MLLYLIGFAMAIFSAYILNIILKIKCKTFFVVEMPSYKLPLFKTLLNVIEKKAFVFGAGKIILSIVLWFMASYGPGENSITQKLYSFQKRKMQEYHKRN
jgi:ferrous iron transport protein B